MRAFVRLLPLVIAATRRALIASELVLRAFGIPGEKPWFQVFQGRGFIWLTAGSGAIASGYWHFDGNLLRCDGIAYPRNAAAALRPRGQSVYHGLIVGFGKGSDAVRIGRGAR